MDTNNNITDMQDKQIYTEEERPTLEQIEKSMRELRKEYTTIKVYSKTRDKLARMGKYEESMADIVERAAQALLS